MTIQPHSSSVSSSDGKFQFQSIHQLLPEKDHTMHFIRRIILTGGVLSCAFFTNIMAANSPQLELFPQSVQESFKQAGSQTMQMQNELTRISSEMKIQEKLYIESKCDSLSDDQGCQQLKGQMREKFMELNDTVQAALPEVKRSVAHAHKTMGKSLQRMANKYTPSQLIKINHEAAQSGHKAPLNTTPHTSLGRIASMFQRVNKAIGSKQTNLYVLASQTYMDLSLINEELALLEQNTSNNTIVNNLGFQFNELSDEKMETIDHYRSLVMGEDEVLDMPVFIEKNISESYETRISKFY